MKKKMAQADLAHNQVTVVANYQSALDLLIVLSLYQKNILIKNEAVSNTFLSKVIFFIQDLKDVQPNEEVGDERVIEQYLSEGYIPVVLFKTIRTNGTTDLQHTDLLKYISKPDTTLIPVIILGTENCLVPGDFILNRGTVILKQLRAVHSINDLEAAFSAGYEELAAGFLMSVHFNKILSSYIYKGPILEWYYRIKVMLEKSYQGFDELLPSKGLIYDLGCGYGFLDYFLNMKSPERTIIGVDYDGDKITVANQSYLKNDRLVFIENDVMQVSVKNADAVVILDVLHYLSAENQKKLIRSSYEGLNKGGILIIRDGDSSQTEKHKGTKLTEFFSTKLLMFNKQTEQELCFISSETIVKILNDYNVEVKIVDDTKYTSNIVYCVVKR